ncbi:DUF401 family protein [Streptococcus loxodontisalivarius]|uniref:Integral membrane protein (TIGR00529 family) n=1 Tax=Streptococcus loxodontisalivarius TaxID=1349415 RepID=A0ABS2PRL9_9STRE|nr:DUF401 family protein [Streptococcus loxodontisalivarius]MBM7642688.1 integral membrane protein (TIGR00529 family) [Streptococcus loxodontisalivarius]
MSLLYLALVFGVIIVLLMLKKPLYMAIGFGILSLIVLYGFDIAKITQASLNFVTNKDSIAILLSMYLITYLQKVLESRRAIKLAEEDLTRLFQNRRVTIAGASLVIGLLPSAAAMVLCADIVKHQTDGYLEPEEQAFTTTWFRHIPESSLPTYPSVLLMASLSGVAMSQFLLFMLVPLLTLFAIGYFRYLRRIPAKPEKLVKRQVGHDLLSLVKHLWSLLLIIILILVFKFEVVPAVLISLVLSVFIYRLSRQEVLSFSKSALEPKLLVSLAFVLYFKEFLSLTGALAELPNALSHLPLPTFMIFVILFFLGGIISGASGIIALGTPLAFAAMPSAGVALLVLLMCSAHAASQISPVHVCLTVASDYYHISLGDLIKKTLPASLLFILLMIGYYLVLTVFL